MKIYTKRKYKEQTKRRLIHKQWIHIRFLTRPFTDHRARRARHTLFPDVITSRAEWRDDSGGVKFTINNNDNKMSENTAASLLTRVSIDGAHGVLSDRDR